MENSQELEPTTGGQEPQPTQGQEPASPTAPALEAGDPVNVSELPANVQHMIAELRAENATARQRRQEAEQAAQAAQEAELAERAEWQTLAEQRAATIAELQPQIEQAAALAATVGQQIDTEIKEWPAEIVAMAPGPDAGITDRIAWLEKARPLVAKLQQAPTPGNGPGPKATQGANDAKHREQQRAAAKRNINRIF